MLHNYYLGYSFARHENLKDSNTSEILHNLDACYSSAQHENLKDSNTSEILHNLDVGYASDGHKNLKDSNTSEILHNLDVGYSSAGHKNLKDSNTSEINANYVFENKYRKFSQDDIDYISEIINGVIDIIIDELNDSFTNFFQKKDKNGNGYFFLDEFKKIIENDLQIDINGDKENFQIFFDFILSNNMVQNKYIIELKHLIHIFSYYNDRDEKPKYDNDKNNLNIINKNVNSSNENNIEKKERTIINNLKVDNHLESSLKIKENNIINILELLDNRIAVVTKEGLKIYNVNNFKLITIIKLDIEKDDIFIELKNKDLVRKKHSNIELYKLSGQKYEIFQTIKKESINYILGLMNGNFVICNNYGIEIYSKEKGEYKKISYYKTELEVEGAIEIENNKLIIFQHKVNEITYTNEYNYEMLIGSIIKEKIDDNIIISFFDIENKKEKILTQSVMKKEGGEYRYDIKFFKFFKIDKYLFVNMEIKESYYEAMIGDPSYKFGNFNRMPNSYECNYINVGYIYNLSKENYLKCETEFSPKNKMILFLSNYNNDFFIGKKGFQNFSDFDYYHPDSEDYKIDDQLKLYKYENNSFKIDRNLYFDIKELKGIVKLKNNNFIIYSSNEIFLFNQIK